MATIAVFAEIEDGTIHDISLQCLAKARALAGPNGRVTALVAGSNVGEAANQLVGHGADEVHVADRAEMAGYLSRPFRTLLSGWIQSQSPDLVLFPATTLGLDLAASAAGAAKCAGVLYGDDIAGAPGQWTVKRIEFDRKVASHYGAASPRPLIVALRDGAAEAAAFDAGRTGAVKPWPTTTDLAGVAKVLKRDVAKKTVNLKAAKIIVAGGAGVGSAENFKLIRDLAAALGAEIGATRAVVDAGWLPADHQIGQTGATVKPDVYIACGISGAVQHRVGMMDSGKIIAINTDPNAPIFKIAHYRIVGDLKAVIPKLLKLLAG